MIRKQVFITAEQNRRLKQRAAETGTAEAEIVRRGIEVALASETSAADWKKGLAELSGAWSDRGDIQDFVRDLRKGTRRRLKRLGILPRA